MEKYTNRIDMKQFIHIPQISYYNSNYYIGFGKDLLFAESDDDNLTEWYFISNNTFIKIGESYTLEGDKLNK